MLHPIDSIDDIQVELADLDKLLDEVSWGLTKMSREGFQAEFLVEIDRINAFARIAHDKVARLEAEVSANYGKLHTRAFLPVDSGENRP